MIYLDDRAGSKELYLPLLKLSVPVTMTRMEYGDVRFEGNGPNGIPALIGIEHKTVEDVIACISDGRFAGHQLPGLHETYNYVFLMVEGGIRSGPNGELQIAHISGRWFDAGFGNRGYKYSDFDHWLTTLELRASVRVRRVRDRSESAANIRALYLWWTRKEWEDHNSHMAFDSGHDLQSALLRKPNLVRRMAKELPGVGWGKSAQVAGAFGSPIEMVGATQGEWENIPGIGKTMAKRIRKELGYGEGE